MLKNKRRYYTIRTRTWSIASTAGATEETLRQMSDKVEATDKEREKHIKAYAGNEATVRHCKLEIVESRDENGHNEQRPSRKFMCHSVQTGCSLEKLYSAGKAGSR